MPRPAVRLLRDLLVVASLSLSLLSLPCRAQDGVARTLWPAFTKSQRQARLWQYGWTGFYGGTLSYDLYRSDHASAHKDRYDARVGMATSVLGLVGLWREPLPYSPAREALLKLQTDRHLSRAERARRSLPLLIQVANQEAARQSWTRRIAPFVVNLAAGLAIGVGDHRPGDGALQFGLGMAVAELQIRTQPTQVMDAWQSSQSFSVNLDDSRAIFHYRWLFSPRGLTFAMVF